VRRRKYGQEASGGNGAGPGRLQLLQPQELYLPLRPRTFAPWKSILGTGEVKITSYIPSRLRHHSSTDDCARPGSGGYRARVWAGRFMRSTVYDENGSTDYRHADDSRMPKSTQAFPKYICDKNSHAVEFESDGSERRRARQETHWLGAGGGQRRRRCARALWINQWTCRSSRKNFGSSFKTSREGPNVSDCVIGARNVPSQFNYVRPKIWPKQLSFLNDHPEDRQGPRRSQTEPDPHGSSFRLAMLEHLGIRTAGRAQEGSRIGDTLRSAGLVRHGRQVRIVRA